MDWTETSMINNKSALIAKQTLEKVWREREEQLALLGLTDKPSLEAELVKQYGKWPADWEEHSLADYIEFDLSCDLVAVFGIWAAKQAIIRRDQKSVIN